MEKKTHTISKSRYIRGLQCHKSLWLFTHRPDLLEKPDEQKKAAFQRGHEVGEQACELFPGGVFISYDDNTINEQISQTQQAIKSAKVIYEAAFYHNGVFIKADILRKAKRGWELYEVKSSTEMKDVYLEDISVQFYVLTGAGMTVSKAFIVHLNKAYVRKGSLNTDKLFTITDVTSDVRKRQPQVKIEVPRQQKMLKGKVPKIDIGQHCNDPYECDFINHCWRHIPDDSIFDLTGKGVDKYALYQEGFIQLKDISLDLLKGKQRQQAEAALSRKTIIDKKHLRIFLDRLWYPLYFLDFETFTSAIPPYDGLHPYQNVPFQYSLHYQKRAGGKLYHKEYLAKPDVDPRKELLEQLLYDIPDGACVLCYYKAFEAPRLRELAKYYPGRKKAIQSLIDNMVDLFEPFKQRHIYSWKQKGSHSIKNVLPAFVKGMTYEGMEIADGGAAMEAYHQMVLLKEKPKELKNLRAALLDYCCQDTLAMVKLLEVINKKSA